MRGGGAFYESIGIRGTLVACVCVCDVQDFKYWSLNNPEAEPHSVI